MYLGAYEKNHKTKHKQGKFTLLLVTTKGNRLPDMDDSLENPNDPERGDDADTDEMIEQKAEFNDGSVCPPDCGKSKLWPND